MFLRKSQMIQMIRSLFNSTSVSRVHHKHENSREDQLTNTESPLEIRKHKEEEKSPRSIRIDDPKKSSLSNSNKEVNQSEVGEVPNSKSETDNLSNSKKEKPRNYSLRLDVVKKTILR